MPENDKSLPREEAEWLAADAARAEAEFEEQQYRDGTAHHRAAEQEEQTLLYNDGILPPQGFLPGEEPGWANLTPSATGETIRDPDTLDTFQLRAFEAEEGHRPGYDQSHNIGGHLTRFYSEITFTTADEALRYAADFYEGGNEEVRFAMAEAAQATGQEADMAEIENEPFVAAAGDWITTDANQEERTVAVKVPGEDGFRVGHETSYMGGEGSLKYTGPELTVPSAEDAMIYGYAFAEGGTEAVEAAIREEAEARARLLERVRTTLTGDDTYAIHALNAVEREALRMDVDASASDSSADFHEKLRDYIFDHHQPDQFGPLTHPLSHLMDNYGIALDTPVPKQLTPDDYWFDLTTLDAQVERQANPNTYTTTLRLEVDHGRAMQAEHDAARTYLDPDAVIDDRQLDEMSESQFRTLNKQQAQPYQQLLKSLGWEEVDTPTADTVTYQNTQPSFFLENTSDVIEKLSPWFSEAQLRASYSPVQEHVRDPELERRLARADWFYDFSDASNVRSAGASEVRAVETAAALHAARSPAHAAWVSEAWDEHAPSERAGRFEGYLSPEDRAEAVPTVPEVRNPILEDMFQSVDWTYDYASGSAWQRGKDHMEALTGAATAHAAHSPAHALWVSETWDKSAPEGTPARFDGYLTPEARTAALDEAELRAGLRIAGDSPDQIDQTIAEWRNSAPSAESDPKYEILTYDTRSLLDSVLHRIRALRDIPEHGVRAGDLGGHVEGEHNLAHDGAAWIADGAMAGEQSRITGSALLRDHAMAMASAMLDDNAIVGGSTLVSGQATIRGNTQINGDGHFSGTVLLDGDLTVSHGLLLTDDAEYHTQDELPWVLRYASPEEPEYEGRLREAVEIDPAFHRVFATFGAQTAEHRTMALDKLLSESDESRDALHRITRVVGGTFSPTGYEPRSAADIMSEQASANAHTLYSGKLSGFRVPHMIGEEPAVEHEDGSALYSGAMRVVTPERDGEPSRTLFQPMIYEDAPSKHPTLTPLSGRVHLVPEVYENFIDAFKRADESLLREKPLYFPGTPLSRDEYDEMNVDSLPVVRDTKRNFDNSTPIYTNRIVMQRVQPSSLDGDDLPGINAGPLSETGRFAAVEVPYSPDRPMDLSRIAAQLVRFQDTPERAYRTMEPAYSSVDDFKLRVPHEIKMREARIAELNTQLDTQPGNEDAIYAELAELDPSNSPVLMKVLEAPEPAPRPAEPATPQISAEALRSALTPLDWRNAEKPNNTGRREYFDDVFEAHSMNTRFTIEPDTTDGTWSLYVDSPSTEPGPFATLFHREDNIATEDAAMEAAEDYRVAMITKELSTPAPSASPAPPVPTLNVTELPAVYRVRSSEGIAYVPGSVSPRDVNYSIATSGTMLERYSDIESAQEPAIEFAREMQARFSGEEIAPEPDPVSRPASPALGMSM